MLTAVFLHGDLGKRYGRKIMLDVVSVADAVSLLKANFKDFAKDLIGEGALYKVFVGKTNISQDELRNPSKGQSIHIVPTIAGAGGGGNGVFKVIAGIVLMIVGVVYGFFTEDWANAAQIINAGATMAFTGVVEMVFFSSSRRLPTSTKEGTSTTISRFFNGPVNTVGQGSPVPLLYGRALVGSQVINGGLTDRDA